MKQVDLIIFDLDGTLIDSRQDIVNAVNFTLRRVNLKEKSLTEIASYIGTGVEDLLRKSLGQDQNGLFDKAMQIFQDYYRQHATDSSRLYPGAKEILEYFQDKRKVVITNRKYEFAQLALKHFGIEQYFADVLGADNLGCAKPSACPLDQTMQKLKIDKAKTIIVGDMDIDILSGKAAGILTCAVTYGIGKKADILRTRPDFIIDNIEQLKQIIK